jgi:hypothetical protein
LIGFAQNAKEADSESLHCRPLLTGMRSARGFRSFAFAPALVFVVVFLVKPFIIIAAGGVGCKLIYFSGSFAGVPAFRGYFAGVFSIFLKSRIR